jgi:hypothetical protein
MVQRDPNHALEPIKIPIEKALLFRTAAHKGSPEGVSILRRSWRAWYFKTKIEEIEAIGIERDLAGLPVMYVPENILRAETGADVLLRDEFISVAVNVRRDEQEAVLMPLAFDEHGNQLYKFELLSSAGSRQIDTSVVLARKDRAIAGTMLADFILVGHEGVGSFALHSDKTALFGTALGSILDSIQAVLNRHLVPRLFALNGWQRESFPTWEHGDVEKMDMKLLGETVRNLAQSGMMLFPDDNLEDHLRHLLSFPARELDGLMPAPVSVPGEPAAIQPGQPAPQPQPAADQNE